MQRAAFALAVSTAVLASGMTLGCRDESREPASVRRAVPPSRGETVVVEQTAAVFFEARVVAAEGGRLRVQAADGDETTTVSASDVYRLVPAATAEGGERTALQPSAYAICRSAPQRWVACRVERATDALVTAVTDAGERLELTRDAVLAPSPVTELNLRRHFERTRERREFAEARARAGEPRAPADYRPLPRERVLARAEQGWYTAYVREVGDDGVSVTWQSDRAVSVVSTEAVVPEPPYPAEFRRGDFVLVRPPTPALPWEAVLVRAVGQDELRVVDIEGRQRSVSAREVVPLAGKPASSSG